MSETNWPELVAAYEGQLKTFDLLANQLDRLFSQLPAAEYDRITFANVGKLITVNQALSEVCYDLHKHITYWDSQRSESAK